jgi:DNA-binding NtrC family response regulator
MKKYSVLVIDDQENWRELLVDLLEDQFNVKSAKDYEGALSAIRNQIPPFHVALTDMRLKDEEVGNEDGLNLIKYLNKRGDETKTIVITGYATLDTAKRALSALKAYDYLEKRPSDGAPFNSKAFQQIVYHAAEDAETKRPKGLTDISYNLLVLDPNQVQRSRLEDILRKDSYQVTVLESDEKLESHDNADKAYSLILVNESLVNDSLFDKLQRLYPEGKIIILTLNDVGKIMDAMREYPVLTAFAMPNNGELNHQELREILHKALPKKYISAQLNFPDQPGQIIGKGLVGKTYHINFSIHDTPSENAVGVHCVPQGSKKGKIKLHLAVHAKGIKVEPETERYWNIPLSTERPQPCHFSITPENKGRKDIIIEIDQENRWVGRIQMKFDVE